MNVVRITYILCDLVQGLSLLALAVAALVWITPGYYWWTAFAILLMINQSHSFTQRLNSWGGMGKV